MERRRLLDALNRAVLSPVVLVAAAAGYGKTTLITQWLAGPHSRPMVSAWMTLEAVDNDPVVLSGHLATVLENAGCSLEHDAAGLLAAERENWLDDLMPRIVAALAGMPEELVLVLDDFHVVQEPASLRLAQFLVEHLPPGAHLVIATRADPALRLGRLRAAGQLAEFRAGDLAFDTEEVTALLAMRQVVLGDDSVVQLLTRTEGWPVGLHLAIMSLEGRADPDGFVRELVGSNRFIGDYLTEEVLSQQADSVRELIVVMSVVDRLCAELCDFVLEATGSARILRELERANVFLVPLDAEGRWFRFHALFTAVARGELEGEQPDRIPLLHARAAQWFHSHGHIEETLTHLLASGDTEEAARVVQSNWMTYVDAGQAATVLRWFGRLGRPPVASDPVAGVTAAWMAGMAGDEATLAAHLATLQDARDYGPLPDGTRSVESAVALMQGLFGYGGPLEMLAGARRAVELETTNGSPHRGIANLALGHAAYVAGDLQLAADSLTAASQDQAAPTTTRVLALSILSLVESEREQPHLSRMFAERAMQTAQEQGVDERPEASMAFAALGQALADAGDLTAAMSAVEQGLALRRKDPARAPWMTLHQLVVSAHVAADAGRLSMARAWVDQAASGMDRFPEGMGPMRDRLTIVEERLRTGLSPATLAEQLTSREHDVLQLLRGSLSLAEIADELRLSPNTVKTHTRALYRKLGAGSRAQAVKIAQQHRLL